MISAFAIHFCIFTVFTFGPKFYKDVYEFQLSKNRWYSIGPTLTPIFGAPLSGFLLQLMNKKLKFNLSMKIVHTFGNLIPMSMFFLLAFLPNLDVVHAMNILTVTFLFVPFFSVTVMRGAIAIKPKFSKLVNFLSFLFLLLSLESTTFFHSKTRRSSNFKFQTFQKNKKVNFSNFSAF